MASSSCHQPSGSKASLGAGEIQSRTAASWKTWSNSTVWPDSTRTRDTTTRYTFVTLSITDVAGRPSPRAKNLVHFTVSGPGEIVATDNGDPTDFTVFGSKDRNAFNGLALAIVRAKRGQRGTIIVTAQSEGLKEATTKIVLK